MFIYNITVKVQNAILEDWMKWQMEEHIPEIMATNLFTHYKCYKLLEQDDTEETTLIFQYHTPDKKNYDEYIVKHA